MLNFEFENRTKIIFGKKVEEQVGALVSANAKKVLLHYGGGSIKKSGLYDRVINSLQEAGVEYVELGGVVANPRVSLVREGIKLCREEQVDFILAVGGGSVIDSAKGIAAGFYYQGDVWELYMREGTFDECLPIGVVLTIPAAGSESSGGSVVTNEDGLWKRDIGSLKLRPVFALLNPELTYTLPNYQTACGISDMLAHVMERYFTRVIKVDLTDRLAEAIMKSVIKQAHIINQSPDDYDARAEIMWAGTLAHNDLVGTGRQGDWASHGIEHELSGIYDIAHGAGLSIVFPAWMKHVYKSDIPRFAQFANRVFDIEINTMNLEETAIKGIEAMESFYGLIGMPTRLSQVNIDETRFNEMANKATNDGTTTMGSFVPLTKADIMAIFELAK
ncbi:NADH-dependent butanol dehydrogenase [Petrocella atlantisensis]|uniref:NADH-dependent butanol dehydrogenase n=1 Tax=Petrocella atlantisensis TaxID=2173034 RepID=A0A3P7NYC0_9FIRM|nr:iron-containing alcohol dehydrogenase [Petrocella atlantisensis]MCF8018507.1 iron-containing alcohol dehydrogenase [Vallitaleaceae bacterium]VDN46280.1 NADH-dependent butanol dehydrogenase [Petrocella atlantisensis]